jgi:hypothetical protein
VPFRDGPERARRAAPEGKEGETRPLERLGSGLGLDRAQGRIEASRGLDAPAGELGLHPLDRHLSSAARDLEDQRDRVVGRYLAIGSAERRRAAQRGAGGRLPPRSRDPNRAREWTVSIQAGEGEDGCDVERVDLADEVPLSALGERRHCAAHRSPAGPRAQDEGGERQPAAVVAGIGLERQRSTAKGERVAP